METGPYLTEIGVEKESLSPQISQQKFTRFEQLNSNSINIRQCPVNAGSNCFRLSNKNISRFLPEEYYECKKVKPGIHFYRSILEAEQRKRNGEQIPSIKINIPDTLVLAENCFQLIHSERGLLEVREDVNHLDFMRRIKKECGENQKPVIYPGSLMANGNGIFIDYSVYLSTQLDSRVYPKNENQAAIHFIQPFGLVPNILRLYYKPKGIKEAKPNFAYKITNKKPLCEQLYLRKHKLIHNYLVDSQKQDQTIVIPVKGKALSDVEEMASSMVQFMEYLHKVKITELVVDFSFGADRVYYFHEIKSVKSVALTRIWDIGDEEEMLKLVKQKNNQVFCRLCGFSYSKPEMNHVVTNKLIIELISHMKSRGLCIDAPLLSQNSTATNLSGNSHVCSLCYDLIIAEHQLIDIQHQFCCMLNMDSNTVERVPQLLQNCKRDNRIKPSQIIKNQIEIIMNEMPTNQSSPQAGMNLFGRMLSPTNNTPPPPAAITKKQKSPALYQWRIFFYVEKVKNIPVTFESEDSFLSHFTLSLSFNDMKEKFDHLTDFHVLRNNQSIRGDMKSAKNSTSRLASTRVQSAVSSSAIQKSHSSTRFQANNRLTKQNQGDKNRPLTSMPKNNLKNSTRSNYLNEHEEGEQMYEESEDFSHKKEAKSDSYCLEVQKVKLLVFYTQTPDINNIIHSQDLKFELIENQGAKSTKNSKYSSANSKAVSFLTTPNNTTGINKRTTFSEKNCMKGQSSTLQNFTNKKSCQRHSCEVLLFDSQYTYCNLELNVGLICDGAFDLSGQVEKSSTDPRIFFPSKMQRNCNPLPEEWIEVITNGVQIDEMEQEFQARKMERMKNKRPLTGGSNSFSNRTSMITRSNFTTEKQAGTTKTATNPNPKQKSNKNKTSHHWNIAEGQEYEDDEEQYL